MNGTHQRLVYAGHVTKLRGSVHSIEKNTEALVAISKDVGIEVNVNKTKHNVMSRDQNAGRSHNIKIGTSSFERLEELKYMGTTSTNKNSIQEEIMSRLYLGGGERCLLSLHAKSFVFQVAI